MTWDNLCQNAFFLNVCLNVAVCLLQKKKIKQKIWLQSLTPPHIQILLALPLPSPPPTIYGFSLFPSLRTWIGFPLSLADQMWQKRWYILQGFAFSIALPPSPWAILDWFVKGMQGKHGKEWRLSYTMNLSVNSQPTSSVWENRASFHRAGICVTTPLWGNPTESRRTFHKTLSPNKWIMF